MKRNENVKWECFKSKQSENKTGKFVKFQKNVEMFSDQRKHDCAPPCILYQLVKEKSFVELLKLHLPKSTFLLFSF